MNWLMAEALRVLNALLALLIIGFGCLVGLKMAPAANSGVAILLGGLGGFIVAVLVCGILAVLLDIRDKLTQIARSADATVGQSGNTVTALDIAKHWDKTAVR